MMGLALLVLMVLGCIYFMAALFGDDMPSWSPEQPYAEYESVFLRPGVADAPLALCSMCGMDDTPIMTITHFPSGSKSHRCLWCSEEILIRAHLKEQRPRTYRHLEAA